MPLIYTLTSETIQRNYNYYGSSIRWDEVETTLLIVIDVQVQYHHNVMLHRATRYVI